MEFEIRFARLRNEHAIGAPTCPINLSHSADDLEIPSDQLAHIRASGDSMNLAGINDGDLVLCRQQIVANEGDRVVALTQDGVTIKELHKKDNNVLLRPRSSNSEHKTILVDGDVQIQGVVQEVVTP